MDFVIQPLDPSGDLVLNSIFGDTGCVHNNVQECGCIHNDVVGCACKPKS